jgi:tRNA dimethylallyltransferase
MSFHNLITVLGPTASGKTRFGANLADTIQGEIISADSRQVYRNMDLGTGKDYDDYIIKGRKIPAHLIDIHDAGHKYNVFEFQKDFIDVFRKISKKGHVPIMVGGTGMYIEAILNRYELLQTPINFDLREQLKGKTQEELIEILKEYHIKLHNTSDLKIRKRTLRAIEIAEFCQQHPDHFQDLPEFRSIIFGVRYDRNSQRSRITQRLQSRLEGGMIEEVRQLLSSISAEDLIYYGLEYKFITQYLQGTLSYAEMCQKLEVAIHQFAKRQMTWFRKMERNGYKIHWLDGHMPMEEKITAAMKIIETKAPELIKK